MHADRAVIEDLTVMGFDRGIALPSGAPDMGDLTIDGVTVRDCAIGMHLATGSVAEVTGSTVEGCADHAILHEQWSDLTVSGCTIRENDGQAITTMEGWDLTCTDNTITDNGAGVQAAPDDVIRGNTITGNAGFGISIDPVPIGPSDQVVTIDGNVVDDNGGTGIELFMGDASIANNSIAGNGIGIHLNAVHGDAEEWGPTATVEANMIEGSDEYGLANDTDLAVAAMCNWWGDADGPSHDDNPNDETDGDAIRGPAEFIPWRTEPDGSCDGGESESEDDSSEDDQGDDDGDDDTDEEQAGDDEENEEDDDESGGEDEERGTGDDEEDDDDGEGGMAGTSGDDEDDASGDESDDDGEGGGEDEDDEEADDDGSREESSDPSGDDEDDDADDDESDTDDDGSEPADPPEDLQTEDDDETDSVLPGFGIGATITAIGGAGYVIVRRLREE